MNRSANLSIDALSNIALRTRPAWRESLAASAASFWREIYRELRRHAGDERLPYDLRLRLRTAAQRAFERSQDEAASTVPRTLLRTRAPLRFTAADAQQARAAVEALGVRTGQPFVAADVRGRDEAFHDSVALLESHGYAVVRLRGEPALDAYLLLTCTFLLCDNAEAQRAAYVTDTPTLMVNATDAFACYPVRHHGVYLLKTAVDLDTGRVLNLLEFLGADYYRRLRDIGYRDNTSAQIRQAVCEMLEGLAHGWHDSEGQARFRAAALAAGESLAPQVRQVAKWRPVNGFIGDGRLARAQAESAA